MENSIKVLKETKNRTTLWSKNSTPGYIFEENENTYSKRYMYPNVHSTIISIGKIGNNLSIHQQMNG